jgi:hypothetical protein
MRFRPHHSITLVLLLGSLLGGCTRQTATFPGHSDPEVWNAMVTVAENPVYDDWFVFENEVMSDRPTGRIEIYRILRRDLVRVGQNPVRQEEDWRFQVQFLYTDPPTIKFSARQTAVPAHVWREADRYFTDMRTILEPDGIAPVTEVETVEVIVETDSESAAEESGEAEAEVSEALEIEVVEPEPSTSQTLTDLLNPKTP